MLLAPASFGQNLSGARAGERAAKSTLRIAAAAVSRAPSRRRTRGFRDKPCLLAGPHSPRARRERLARGCPLSFLDEEGPVTPLVSTSGPLREGTRALCSLFSGPISHQAPPFCYFLTGRGPFF
jgi:hypothetical protein